MLRVILLSLVSLSVVAQPIRPHPDNARYFQFQGQPTVLVTSGEHYGAVLNRDFDFVRYLDTLRANHLNLTRTFSGTYREVAGDFAIASNTLAPASGAYLAPWLQREGKFDLTRWDDRYFERLRSLPRRRNLWVTDTLQTSEARLAQPASPMWDSAASAFPVRSQLPSEVVCPLR